MENRVSVMKKLRTTWYWQKRASIPWKFNHQAMPAFANTSTLCAIREADSSMIKLHGYVLCSCIFFLACVNRYQGQSLSEHTINDKNGIIRLLIVILTMATGTEMAA